MISGFKTKSNTKSILFLSILVSGYVLLLGFQTCLADIENLKDVAFPRKSLIKGACLEFQHDPYILDRLSQYDLIIGSSLFPEYWLQNETRERFLTRQMAEVNVRNDRIVMIATLFYSYKIWGVDPQAPDDMWLRDMDGKMIPGAQPGSFLIDITKSETRDYITRNQVKHVKKYQYHEGVFLDAFCTGFPSPEKVKLDLDGNGQQDSATALKEKWKEAGLKTLQALRKELGSESLIIVSCNESLDKEMRELVNGIVYNGNFDPEILPSDMEDTLDKISKLTSGFAEPTAHTITQWADPSLVAECKDIPWQEYIYGKLRMFLIRAKKSNENRAKIGLATAMLSGHFYAYEFSDKWPGQIWWYDEYNSPLGKPVENWVQIEHGIFQREFQAGLIILNTTNKKYERSFAVKHHDMTNHTEGAWFTLEPGTYKILARKLEEARDYKFRKVPAHKHTLYPKEATVPLRPLPPGVASFAVSTSKDATRSGMHNLFDGVSSEPSLWISQMGMPQFIEVKFKYPTYIKSVSFVPASPTFIHNIYEYDLKVESGGEWKFAKKEKNNKNTKKITVKIDQKNCTGLILQVKKTGDNRLYLREFSWE